MKFKIKSIALFFISILLVPFLIQCTNTNNKKTSEKLLPLEKRVPKDEEAHMFHLYADGKIKGEPLNDALKHKGPVYYQGWAKYFRYDNGGMSQRPKDFFQNNEYFNQKVLKRDLDKKDKWGTFAIPTKFHFFLTLTRDTLSFVSSRKNQLQKSVDSLQVDLINPIPKEDMFKGGVQKLGEFDEGYCFQILTTTPSGPDPTFDNVYEPGISQNWVICFDGNTDRSSIMKILANIKLLKQKVRGENFSTKKPTPPSLSKLLKPIKTPRIERYYGPGHNLDLDGFWVLLNNWSQCTLKCGGGLQYQQWQCQPPLQGGKPCQGMPIRTRPCNIKPCPSVSGYNPYAKKKDEQIVKPIIKSMPWSSRYQRYIECEVKETDVLYIKWDVPTKMGEPVKYPGRMVMTNSTIALYEDDHFEHNLFTFDLPATQVGSYKKDTCCFMIQSLDKQWRICGFNSECGTREKPKFRDGWLRDFNLFAKKCYKPLPKKNWKISIKEDIFHGSVDVNAREHIIGKKMLAKQQMDLDKRISSTQELALKAIRKELKLERLVKHEEKIKEKAKIKDLIKLKLKEEKKKDCLEKALKDREKQNLRGRNAQEAELEIARIKTEAKKDVEHERLALRKKLDLIKKNAKRRRRMLAQQISVIRSTMAKSLLLANKNGDMNICIKSQKDPQLIKEYCDQNFVTSYTLNQECKEIDNFCAKCCEHEFGGLYLNKRDECYKKCDELIKKGLKGDWIWATK